MGMGLVHPQSYLIGMGLDSWSLAIQVFYFDTRHRWSWMTHRTIDMKGKREGTDKNLTFRKEKQQLLKIEIFGTFEVYMNCFGTFPQVFSCSNDEKCILLLVGLWIYLN